MLLSNTFNNKFDNLVNTSDKKNFISCCQTRNTKNPQLLGIGRNRVVGYSERREGIKNVNNDMSEVCFLDQGIIKCN